LPADNPVNAIDWNGEKRRDTGMGTSDLKGWFVELAALDNPIRREFHLFTLVRGLFRARLSPHHRRGGSAADRPHRPPLATWWIVSLSWILLQPLSRHGAQFEQSGQRVEQHQISSGTERID
jgi:hypothetical protein